MRTTIRTTSWLGAVAAVALLAGLSACASNSTTTPPAAEGSSSAALASSAVPSSASGSASGTAASGAASTGFEGTTLVATEVTGAYTIAPGSTISLTFENGSLSARAGCNSLFGSYTISGDVLTAPQLASTMMACDEALMNQDAWLSAFLASSPTWTYADATLTLTNGTDTLVMTAAPSSPAALETTGWKLIGLISTTATASSMTAVDPTLNPWVRFSAGEVAFNTSCNFGGGTVEIADSAMTFGPLRTTLIACDGSSASTEQAMLAVLQGATPYTLSDDPGGALLVIMSTDGTQGLQFVAEATVGADAFSTAGGSAPATESSTG